MIKKKGPKLGTSYKQPKPFTFGQKLYTLRVRKGITQKELARRLATTVRAVSYYEREAKNPTLDVMEKVAQALDVPVKFFLDSKAKPNGPGMPEVIRSLKQRIPKLPTLTRKEQENLVGVIDGFLAKHNQKVA
jgi:transcriptional regulator with XRE-family HTH domain